MTIHEYIAKYGTDTTWIVASEVLDRLLMGEGANDRNKNLAKCFNRMMLDLKEVLHDAHH